ncbi:hypothetical protein EIL87_07960 [Saccharopolyspora rhizosphaerae]|uniref:Putative T7SS secretion signal domain-containing protein n=1 Tax=Saccharopolyspora rhizosphaerae TaxID=2492662 RepID=A0A3R8QRU6_9PSEU|nr:hypothetical protein [Saccharopolyspora rhizosphaerae]RRO18172.1 hypothetical protein EIL87_07960 [Saccharopolyspora rhizosphaerae]
MSGKYPSLGFDPARGDVAAVRSVAKQLDDTATYSREAHEVLVSVKNQEDVWKGEAAKAFVGSLGELPQYLADAQESLNKASKALATWGDRLQEHQTEASRLEERARLALQNYEAKTKAAENARNAAQHNADDPALRDAAVQKINAANDAWDEVEDIRRKAGDLQDTWQDDARTCADKLNDAAQKAPNKPFFDSLSDMWDDAGKWFKDHLGDIGDIAGIVSAVAGALAFIPVCAPIAGPVALIAGGVALAAHGADMVVNEKYDDMNGWISLGGDVAGLIPGVGAISKGFNAAGDVVAGADRLVDVSRATGASGMLDTAGEAVYKGGRAFAQEAGEAAQEPAKAFDVLADKVVTAHAPVELQHNVAKAFQGGTSVALQVPAAAGLISNDQATTDAKNVSGAVAGVLSGLSIKGAS